MDWALKSKNAVDEIKNSIAGNEINSVMKLNEDWEFLLDGRMPKIWHDSWTDRNNFIATNNDNSWIQTVNFDDKAMKSSNADGLSSINILRVRRNRLYKND